MNSQIEQELFDIAKKDIYKFEKKPFTLVSGRQSHHYFNCKGITMHPVYLRLLANVIYDKFFVQQKLDIPELVGGLTLGADPVAFALAQKFFEMKHEVFPVIVRKEAKKHGTGKQIEGLIQEHKNMILLDDVITTAGSSIKALEVLRGHGLKISKCIAIIDRQEGGEEALKQNGVQLYSVFKKSDFNENPDKL